MDKHRDTRHQVDPNIELIIKESSSGGTLVSGICVPRNANTKKYYGILLVTAVH